MNFIQQNLKIPLAKKFLYVREKNFFPYQITISVELNQFGETKMDNDQRLGFLLSIVGAFLGIVGGMVIFFLTYEPYMLAERTFAVAEEGCEIIIQEYLPIIADLAVIGGILFLVAAYGFFTNEKWAVSLAVVGNTLCLLAGFWPTIPAMQLGLTPIWGIIFLPNLVIFVVMTRYIEDIRWITVIFALLTGIAYVMTFLNGVASTNRMGLYHAQDTASLHAVFKGLQRLNWTAAIGFGIVTIGIIRRPKAEWVRLLAFASAALGIAAGYPVAIASSISFNKVSMFFMAPILATFLIVIPLWPKLWNRIVKQEE